MSQEPNFLNRSSEGAGLGRVGGFEVQPLPWRWVCVALSDVHICSILSQKRSHWLPHRACWGGPQGHGGRDEDSDQAGPVQLVVTQCGSLS